MIPITGRVLNAAETIQAFGGLPSLFRQAGMGAMTDVLTLFSRTVRERFLVGPYPQEIMRRSGSFRATFARGHAENIWTVQAQGTAIVGTFGSQDKRARILNDGGTIRPTRSQFLAIRTEFTKTAAGVVQAKYLPSLRGLPNTFVRMRGADRGTVFEKRGRRIVPIAWLVRSVTIVGRRFMQKTEAVVQPLLGPLVQATFDQVLTHLQTTLARRLGRR